MEEAAIFSWFNRQTPKYHFSHILLIKWQKPTQIQKELNNDLYF